MLEHRFKEQALEGGYTKLSAYTCSVSRCINVKVVKDDKVIKAVIKVIKVVKVTNFTKAVKVVKLIKTVVTVLLTL